MNDSMNTDMSKTIPNSFLAYPAMVALMLYVFAYQFAYPFSSTIFLYIAFGCSVVWMIFCQRVNLTIQMLIMALVVLVSAIGTLYTDVPDKGNREAILTLVTWILLITFVQNDVLLANVKRMIYVCSFIVLIGVLFQYVFTDAANNMLQGILRSDCYEQLIYSYEIDGAYAGLSAYTPDAAYFCATLFGFVIFGWLQDKDITYGNKVFRTIVILLSIFAIILTSKRGVTMALFVAFILTYMIWKKFSVKAFAGTIVLILVGIVLVDVFSDGNGVISLFLQRFDATGGDITTGRIDIWQKALKNLSNEVFGMGTGAAYGVFSSALHNIYLQIYYDHGMFGLIVYLFFFAYNLSRAVKRQDPMAMYIQLLMLVYGISGNPIYSNSFFIVYIIFSAVPVLEDQDKDKVLSQL